MEPRPARLRLRRRSPIRVRVLHHRSVLAVGPGLHPTDGRVQLLRRAGRRDALLDDPAGHARGNLLDRLDNRRCAPPELKLSTPAHAKQLGWYLEFESRVTQASSPDSGPGGLAGSQTTSERSRAETAARHRRLMTAGRLEWRCCASSWATGGRGCTSHWRQGPSRGTWRRRAGGSGRASRGGRASREMAAAWGVQRCTCVVYKS